MKITNEILIDIGFIYDRKKDNFSYSTVDGTLIRIFKKDKYWLYINYEHPGYEIECVKDIMGIIYSTGFKNGTRQKIKEIQKVLGIYE